MALNMLKLNDDKTEFIIFRARQQLAKVSTINIKIGTESITPTDFVKNLGFFMDKFLKGEQHIGKISSQLYLQLKNMSNQEMTGLHICKNGGTSNHNVKAGLL